MTKELLEDFVEWLEKCGEDVFYIFDHTQEAIEKFLNEHKNK
jgi:hypothetical protein